MKNTFMMNTAMKTPLGFDFTSIRRAMLEYLKKYKDEYLEDDMLFAFEDNEEEIPHYLEMPWGEIGISEELLMDLFLDLGECLPTESGCRIGGVKISFAPDKSLIEIVDDGIEAIFTNLCEMVEEYTLAQQLEGINIPTLPDWLHDVPTMSATELTTFVEKYLRYATDWRFMSELEDIGFSFCCNTIPGIGICECVDMSEYDEDNIWMTVKQKEPGYSGRICKKKVEVLREIEQSILHHKKHVPEKTSAQNEIIRRNLIVHLGEDAED